MRHYKIRSTKETLKKIFQDHLNDACFCVDTEKSSDSGVCDVVVITGSEAVEKILTDHFAFIKIEFDDLDFTEDSPEFYSFETFGNRKFL